MVPLLLLAAEQVVRLARTRAPYPFLLVCRNAACETPHDHYTRWGGYRIGLLLGFASR
jgi:hypothetical protein